MSIIIPLPHIENLEIKLNKSKNSYKVFDMAKSKTLYSKYLKAKNLEPFGEYKNPYWDFLLLSNNYFFGLGKDKKIHTSLYDQELYSIIYKFKDTIFISKEMGQISLTYYPIYKKFFPIKANKNLFIVNNRLDIFEEYLFFSEYNNHYSYDEKNNLIFLKNHTFDKEDTIEESKENIINFMKKKPEVNFDIYDDNICNIEHFKKFLEDKDYEKLDNILIDCSIYLRQNKKNRAYYDSQGSFNLIISSLENLKKNGNIILSLNNINSQLSLDLIALLQIYFQEVFIIKTSTERIISDEKKIIAKKFLGIKDIKYFVTLKNVLRDWYNYEKSCGLDIIKEPIENKYYITSIFNYKDNYQYYKDFIDQENSNKLKNFEKIIENYNYVKKEFSFSEINAQEAEKDLINKLFQRSIQFLKENKIPVKLTYANFNKKILDITLDLNDRNIYKKFNRKYKQSASDNNFKRLNQMENNLKIYKRKMDNMNMKKYYDISKIFIKPFRGLNKELELRTFSKNISQGFIKMYEMLTLFNLIDKKDFKSFHLCEAPGQFIRACKVFINRNLKNTSWYWNAQSLHPSIGGALEDDYGLIADNPDRWDFGSDKTGDITKIKNIKYYSKKFKDYDLITFDCGFGFDKDTYTQTYQDKVTAQLNFASILMTLNGLKKGGNFVNKIFLPQNLPAIICLNYLVITSFKDVYIYKPLQNPNSSEVYMVAKNFKGIDKEMIDKLFEIYKKKQFKEFFIDLPQDFIQDYTNIITFFIQKNINALSATYYYYDNDKYFKEEKIYIKKKQKQNVVNWLKKFNLYKF